MRCPAVQEQHLEARLDAPRRTGKALIVDLRRPQQGAAPAEAAATLGHQVALAHGAQVAHQGEGARIFDVDRLAVGHRHGEPGALQQASGIAQVRERRDARAEPALDLALGGGKSLAQLPERAAAQHAGEEEPVRLQDAPDLDQRARQIVHPVQAHRAQHEIEGAGRKRQSFLVGDDGGTLRPPRKPQADVRAHQSADGTVRAQGCRDLVAVAAEIEGQRKGAAHIVEPLDDTAGDLPLEESLVAPTKGRTLPPSAQGRAVENQQGIGCHRVYVGGKPDGG